jgi:chaperone required for assembly of F1-ATPase
MKRVYKLSSHIKNEDGYSIQLDGKVIKTSSGQQLTSPNKILADAIVAEWATQGDTVAPDTMPMTQILTTAIDRMRDRDAITKAILKYLDTDLLCYRVKEPVEIFKRQKEIWDKWLTWFDEQFESPLEVTFGIEALKQDEDTHKQIWNYLESLDDYYFTVLQVVTSLTGSIVLGLAFVAGDASPEDVYDAAELEEIYHSEIAGEDVHGGDPVQEKRQNNLRRELKSCREFMNLLDAE